MKELISKIKDFLSTVGQKVVDLIGLDFSALWAGVIVFALALTFLIIVIVSIVCGVKRKKRKAKALEDAKAKASLEKFKQATIVQKSNAKEQVATKPAPAVKSAPVEKPAEAPAPVVEEKPVETPAPEVVVKEEIPAPVVEEKTQLVEAEKKEEAVEPNVVEEVEEKPVEVKPAKKTLNGKWVVELKSVGEFMSKLIASNGEVMLSSEIYSSEDGARAGIATIIKWVEDGNFVIYQDKKKNYYYKLKTAGNRLICVGEIYKSKDQCEHAVESVKRIAKTAVVSDDLIEGARYVDYKPLPFDMDKIGLKGKWRVETLDDGKFSARLYASNGQLMISTEEVATRKTALNAIESVKKNSVEGNFIVDRDKFGRYYYKLRNAQKSVICIGEAYDSLDSCTKALESVRRFAVNSIVIPE